MAQQITFRLSEELAEQLDRLVTAASSNRAQATRSSVCRDLIARELSKLQPKKKVRKS